MDTYQLSLTACLWRLENGLVLAESPTFPELCCAGMSGRQALQKLRRGTRKLAQRMPREELVRRQSVGPIQADQLRLTVDPPVRSAAWMTPVNLNLAIAVWPHSDDAWVLWIPALAIHVVGRTEHEVRELAVTHSRAAIARDTSLWDRIEGISLPQLISLQRTVKWRLISVTVGVTIQSPKAAVQTAEQQNQPKKSVLKEAATSLTAESTPKMIGNEQAVANLASILNGRKPRSVLLVGPSGVGKTAAFRSLVNRRGEFGLEGREFHATSGSRLIAGMSGFGMWQERCQSLCRETEKLGAIVHLGSLMELVEVGRCEGNTMGIASFLRPFLVRGALLAVAECTPEQLAMIERTNPQVAQAFEVIRVDEPNTEMSRMILTRFADEFPQVMIREADGAGIAQKSGQTPSRSGPQMQYGPHAGGQTPFLCEAAVADQWVRLIDDRGLMTIERLHRRYATYSAFPGRPLRFLNNLLRDRLERFQFQNHLTSKSGTGKTGRSNSAVVWNRDDRPALESSRESVSLNEAEIMAAFARETGLPIFLLDDRISFDPASAKSTLSQRVVGQDGAVDCVVSLLSRVKAGLARSGRPLASLMFIGPTGVGKTELARTLAAFLFGDDARLTSIDMSEFSDPISAQRLIGGSFGDEGVLTSKIREQPFSVVLLDEFEKADPLVFDLLLQVLGEGRLTDSGGRLADFTNSVIVLTSNLGAESYQRGAVGFTPRRAEMNDHFLEAVRQFVRPELFNRFDAIVPFNPLNSEDLHRIAELQIDRIKARDGAFYRVRSWQIDPAVIDWLTHRGFDPRYGARPLKRTIERDVLAPLSEKLNSIRPELSVTVSIGLAQETINVDVAPIFDQSGRAIDWTRVDESLSAGIANITKIRRRTRRMIEGEPARTLRNLLYRLDTQLERERRRMLKRTALGKSWKPAPDYTARLSQAAELRLLIEDLSSLGSAVDTLEDQSLLGLLADKHTPTIDRTELARLETEWWRLATDVYLHQFPNPNKLTLAVFSEDSRACVKLMTAFREVVTLLGRERLELWEFTSGRQGMDSKLVESTNPEAVPVWHRRIHDLQVYLNDLPESVVGLAWSISGRGLYPQLRAESGIHTFIEGSRASPCLVIVEATETHLFVPPNGIARMGTISKRAKKERLREYDLSEQQIVESMTKQRTPWRGTTLERKLEQLIRQRFESAVETAVIGKDHP